MFMREATGKGRAAPFFSGFECGRAPLEKTPSNRRASEERSDGCSSSHPLCAARFFSPVDYLKTLPRTLVTCSPPGGVAAVFA
jgi:hypothetical protein